MHPEDKKNSADSRQSIDQIDSSHSTQTPHSTRSTHSALNTLSTIIFYLAILFFIIGFNFSDRMAGNWYQQFLPNIGGRTITDVFFLDSLTVWAVTNATNQNPDTTFVLKTTNSGDNWVIQYRKVQTGGGFSGYFKIFFLDQNTRYSCGATWFEKTTNGGLNWSTANALSNAYLDMSILSTDTIWLVSSDGLTGGVFFTGNGGANWQNQLNIGSQNPEKIYMFNSRIGYISRNMGSSGYVRKTTNGGLDKFYVGAINDNSDYHCYGCTGNEHFTQLNQLGFNLWHQYVKNRL
jgi:hypothetical protein